MSKEKKVKNKTEKEEKIIIRIQDLDKDYKVYARKKDRLLESIFPLYNKHGIFKAMDNLNLEVRQGEILGILGKNGAGKSTLLKMITGVVTQTTGSIDVEGKISSLLELGTAFNTELTGMENIYQHGQVMGLKNSEIKAREQEIIDFADIGKHLFQPVKTYSSGMFARLAFACAINVDPDVLIVDEVLSVGDMAFQLKCFKKFEEFKKKGKTILFVTHNISDVLKNCTRTIIIESGRKIFDGDVKDGVEKYKKMIVGLDVKERREQDDMNDTEALKHNKNYKKNPKLSNMKLWKENFNLNPNVIEYGNKKAEVIDFGVFDLKDQPLVTIDNDKEVVFKSKILFNQDVKDPIFTMTIKNFNGIEMCGTNTLIENVLTGNFKKDDIAVVEFKQVVPIAPNRYTVSFSCTRFNEKSELEVLDRKYDALLLEVLSIKECVGLANIESNITFKKI
ncbi:MAG: ABC transporter ATP-binding protein [Clostridia bacterium]